MSKIKNVQGKVMFLLKYFPKTRNSDRMLQLEYYDQFVGCADDSFRSVMQRSDLPSFESIRRARQKIQEVHPELRAVKEVEDKRIEMQEEYLEYAREGGM